ncbi:MAG: hypothetical protein CVU60_01910 [Deltaproteobacteria bacterium HGW-Deltaproteobacteria-18]|nr:MAG: hypothetical protein CVU60_01910 [Deltaproteobacteria bacterium HGW-Deltaproteobacteria-18]
MKRLLIFLMAALLFVGAAQAAPVDYFAEKEALWERWSKVMHRYPEGPKRTAAFHRYITEPLERLDPGRIQDVKTLCQDAGVPYNDNFFSAGSPPGSKDFKPGGDVDAQAPTIRQFYRMRDAATKRGLKTVDNGNSFTVPSHELTVHMKPSDFENPTGRGGYEAAIMNDPENAERVAQTGSTSIPLPGGAVRLQRNLMSTPVTAASDYFKKAHEAREFLEGAHVSRQRVIESLNFSNKAAYKMAGEMRMGGLNPGMAIHRKTLAELDAELGNRVGKEAVDYARKVNDRAFQRLNKMTDIAARQSARDFAALKNQIVTAEKSGDIRKAIALRQQLNNTRQQVQRVAEMSNKRGLVSRVVDGVDDAADAGGRGSRFLKGASERLGKVTPALKRLGGKLLKGLGYAARLAQLYAFKKEYDAAVAREEEWAARIGRDPSTGGIAKEFLFGALGFNQAKERTDAAMEQMGKDKDMLSWEYLKIFLAVEAYQVLDAIKPSGGSDPGTRMVVYLQQNPEFARKLLGREIHTVPGTPLIIPVPPEDGPKAVAKGKDKTPESPPTNLPPAFGSTANGTDDSGKEGNMADAKAPEPVPEPAPEPKAEPAPLPEPKPTPHRETATDADEATFNPARDYTIVAIALETELRVCKTGGNTSETLEGVKLGSLSVIVRQDGRDMIIADHRARDILVKEGLVRIVPLCGYVTTAKYRDFGPGITQGGEPDQTMSHDECMEKYCPGCAQFSILGTGFGYSHSAEAVGDTPDTYCADCLEENRARINACAGF